MFSQGPEVCLTTAVMVARIPEDKALKLTSPGPFLLLPGKGRWPLCGWGEGLSEPEGPSRPASQGGQLRSV